MSNLIRWLRAAPLVLVVALGVGCSTDPKAKQAKYLNDGKQGLASGKYEEAAIHFRNAIKVNPKLAEPHLGLARAYTSMGMQPNAITEFQEALTLDSTNRDAKLELARLYILRRLFDRAETLLHQMIEEDPKNAPAHAILGQRYAEASDLPNSIRELREAVRIDPRAEYLQALAAIQLSSGNTSQAELTYKRGVSEHPDSVLAHVALGQFYVSQRRLAEAIVEMRRSCDLDGQAIAPRVFLAHLYSETGQKDDAEKLLRTVRTLAPEDPNAYQALGLFYANTGQTEKAVAEFRSILIKKPKDGDIRSKLVEGLIDLGRAAEAEPLNRDILAATPSDLPAVISAGRILLFQGKSAEAAVEFEKAIKIDPRLAQGYYLLGLAQRGHGLTSMAKASLSRALELNPDMAEATAALTSLSVRTGDYDRAARLAASTLRSDPKPAAPYVANAEIALAQGNKKDTEVHLEEALRRDPVYLPALGNLVKLLASQGRSGEAVKRLSALVQAHPANAGLQLLLGVALVETKDFDRAELSVRKALELDPKTPEAYTVLANIELSRGNVEKAKAHLRNAIQANPRNITIYLALAGLHQRKGEWDDAKRLCEKAHAIDPADPAAAARLAYFYLEHGGDFQTALSLAQQVKGKLPDSAVADDVLGWAYFKLGSSAPALAQLQESVRKVPNNPIFQYHLGAAYLAAGKTQSAERSLQLALRVDPTFIHASDARSMLERISSTGR